MKVALNKGRPCSIACTPRSAASDRLRPIPTRSSIISPLRHSPDEPLPCCLNHRQLLATSAGSRGAILCANMLCHSELDDTPFVASPLTYRAICPEVWPQARARDPAAGAGESVRLSKPRSGDGPHLHEPHERGAHHSF